MKRHKNCFQNHLPAFQTQRQKEIYDEIHQENATIRVVGPIPSTRSKRRQRGRYRHLGLDEAEQVAKVTETSTAPTVPAGEETRH